MAGHVHQNRQADTLSIDADDAEATAGMLDVLAGRRVVFVGETHDRYDHHLNQLTLIRGLHARGVPVAIGMEQFQHPFQRHLDDFVAGQIDEAELLARTEWAERWRFDSRLYQDILAFLNANPDQTLVVLAGAGHVAHDDAIPARLRRLAPGPQAVVMTDTGWLPPGAAPDYLFVAKDLTPDPAPRLALTGRD